VGTSAVGKLWRKKTFLPLLESESLDPEDKSKQARVCAYLRLHRRGFQIINFITVHNSVTLVAGPEYLPIDMDK
jgi:hypothetical protein